MTQQTPPSSDDQPDSPLSSEPARQSTKAVRNRRTQRQQIQRAIKYRLMAKRNRLTYAIFLLALLLALCLGIWWALWGQYEQVTEDAYVEGNVVLVTAQVAGTAIGIQADTTDIVAAGQALVALNPVDAGLALAKAEANLAQSVRSVRGQFASKDQLQSLLVQRQSELTRARSEYQRRRELAQSGAVATEELQSAQQAVAGAEAAVSAAKNQLSAGRALVDHASIETHPNVVGAVAELREAYVYAARTHIVAPVGGMVTKRNVQVGQHVAAGTSLMAIVPLDQVWVSANFKESQLKDIRMGQPATLVADMYGQEVVYHGRVVGMDAGTGSAFALLPAQNATGNWIKVVQRLPVRIALDAKEVQRYPLRIGLTMRVRVLTKERGERQDIGLATLKPQAYETAVFADELAEANELINQIIQANLAYSRR